MVRVILLHSIFGGVVHGALTDPGPDQIDLGRIQRISLLRHLRFTIDGGDHFNQFTLVRLMRNDRRMISATGEQADKAGHHVLTLGFCWLMATMAIGLKDRTDIAIVTDRGSLLWSGLICPGEESRPGDSASDAQAKCHASEPI